MALAVYRVLFAPVYENQSEDDLRKSENIITNNIGVKAESIDEAIQKVRDEFEGEEITIRKRDSDEDSGEEWKKGDNTETVTCDKVVILSAELVSFIDIE